MKKTCMLALIVLMSGASAGAADKNKANDDKTTASEHKAHSAKTADDPNKVICHTDQATGSRVHIKRVCHTRAEWADLDERTRRGLNAFSQSAGQAGSSKSPFGPN